MIPYTLVTSRKELPKCALGDYCELMVAAAFIADGAEVAFPFGNQYRWDMVIRETLEGEWLTVQVKTIPDIKYGQKPTVNVCRQDKAKSAYTATDIRLLVAVHPETGTMWKVPIEVFSGTRTMRLKDHHVWNGNVIRQTTPMSADRRALIIRRLETNLKNVHATQAIQRTHILKALPDKCPEGEDSDTWEMVRAWASGEGYKTISKRFGSTHPNIRDRILRALRRWKIAGLPESFRKPPK